MNQNWDIVEALMLIRHLQSPCMSAGYYLALGGGVLNKGWSSNDLDLVAVPRTLQSDRRTLLGVFPYGGLSFVSQTQVAGFLHWEFVHAETGRKVEVTVTQPI